MANISGNFFFSFIQHAVLVFNTETTRHIIRLSGVHI